MLAPRLSLVTLVPYGDIPVPHCSKLFLRYHTTLASTEDQFSARKVALLHTITRQRTDPGIESRIYTGTGMGKKF